MGPIEKMIKKVIRISENPLLAAQEEENEALIAEKEREEAEKRRAAGEKHEVKKKKPAGPRMETEVLE